jgi:two-component system, NarL family, sensor histidine kinase DevS
MLDRPLLSHARQARRDAERAGARSRAARRRSDTALEAGRQARIWATYARIVGTRNGLPVYAIVQNDGTIVGKRVRDDPLQAVLEVARECEHVESLQFCNAGLRPHVRSVGATASLVPAEAAEPDSPTGAPGTDPDALRQRIANILDRVVVRQLAAVSMAASSYQERAEDPLMRKGFGLIAKWLDDAVLELRSSVPELGLPPHGGEAGGEAGLETLARVIVRLSTLGEAAASLERQTADPFVQGRLVRFVATLDQGLADLRHLSGDAPADMGSAAAMMADLVEAAPDGMLLVDEDGRITFVNHQVEALFGYERGELVGQPVEMLVPEAVEETHRDHRARYAARPGSRPMGVGLVLSGRRRDGSQFPVEISLSPLHFADGLRTIATVRDITDRVQAEEPLRRVERALAVGEDRRRIARDLHDRTIQRLFATGLAAQSLRGRIAEAALQDRLEKIVEDLDATILDLRSSIFELDVSGTPRSLRAQVLEVCAEARPTLGFPPGVRFVGPVDTVDPSVGGELLTVLREALSNAGRHAHATDVVVTVSTGESLALLVDDDGDGLAHGGELRLGNGIHNMRTRAQRLGGTFGFGPKDPAGTRVEWRIPLP